MQAATVARVLVVFAAGWALVACDGSPSPPPPPSATPSATATPEPAELAVLRERPWRLPTLAPGAACPLTQPVTPDPLPPSGHPLSNGGPASALGQAPVFPDARFFDGGNQLRPTADPARPGWYTTKVPWASRIGYVGWVLVRAARLDGPGQVRMELVLDDGTKLTGDTVALNVQADWQFWPGSTAVSAAGCYAYQIDGSGFTEVIVFGVQLMS